MSSLVGQQFICRFERFLVAVLSEQRNQQDLEHLAAFF